MDYYHPKLILAIVLVAVLTIIVIVRIYTVDDVNDVNDDDVEGFATKEEKAEAVLDWFRTHPDSTYRDYRERMNKGSNIVEYADMRRALMANPDLTIDDTMNIIA